MKNIQPLHLILGGCGLAIVGTFLPWASVKIGGLGLSNTASGINSTWGVIAMILMAGVIGSCYAKVPGKNKLIATGALAAAGLGALLIIKEFISVLTSGSDVKGFEVSISVGIGLYLCLLGAAAGGYGAFLRWQQTPADPVAPGPPAGGPPPQP